MSDTPRIAVIGAGPGGLTLARILALHGISAAVFERETHSAARPQGGSLDMHPESGQYAIEQAALTGEFKRFARYEDQESRVYDQHGHLHYVDAGAHGDRPEIDRQHLRQMLLDSVAGEAIRWNHELLSVNTHGDATVGLTFKNGVSETFDLVIGADGAWSRVRPLLSTAQPIYSGVIFVELGIADADARYPEIAKLVGRGLMFALGDSKAIIAHRDANAHIGIYAGMRAPEDRGAAPSAEVIRRRLAAQFAGWSEDLLQIVQKCDDHVVLRGIYALPIGHRWQHRPGLTLLGDAAHLMSPFSGEGANLAMLDAADLALALAGSGAHWRPAVEQFELKMFERAEQAALGAKQGIDETFSSEGLAHTLAHMKTIHATG